jgi:hypothetical protein
VFAIHNYKERYIVGFGVVTTVVLEYSAASPVCEPTFRRNVFTSIFTVKNQPRKGKSCSSWFIALLIVNHEDGGNTFLRNVGSHTDYTALYLRRCRLSVIHWLQPQILKFGLLIFLVELPPWFCFSCKHIPEKEIERKKSKERSPPRLYFWVFVLATIST